MNAVVGLAGVLLLAACGGEDASAIDREGLIEREVFVQTYIELRMEAFDNTPRVITEGERDAILEARDVSADDLRSFVKYHGPNVAFMRDLWADIEAQILSLLTPENDSVHPGEGPLWQFPS